MRKCCNPQCQQVIAACMGFVIARDFLAFLEGKLTADKVRELCGKCIIKFQLGIQGFEEFLKINIKYQKC